MSYRHSCKVTENSRGSLHHKGNQVESSRPRTLREGSLWGPREPWLWHPRQGAEDWRACSGCGISHWGCPHDSPWRSCRGQRVGEGKCLRATSVSLPASNTESHYINIDLSSCDSHPSSHYYSRGPAHRQGACSLSLSPGPTALAPGRPGGCLGQKWITTSLWPSSQPCPAALSPHWAGRLSWLVAHINQIKPHSQTWQAVSPSVEATECTISTHAAEVGRERTRPARGPCVLWNEPNSPKTFQPILSQEGSLTW